MTYISDHQAPESLDTVDEGVLELAAGTDLLIHDAQYTDEDWKTKSHWGHCTVDYAVDVAIKAGARALALFHHDPSRTDVNIDRLTAQAKVRGLASGVDVFAASEGLCVDPRSPIGPQLSKRHVVGPMFAGNANM